MAIRTKEAVLLHPNFWRKDFGNTQINLVFRSICTTFALQNEIYYLICIGQRHVVSCDSRMPVRW